jgi:hypothetical protein
MPRLLLHRILVVALAFSAGSALRAEEHCNGYVAEGIYRVAPGQGFGNDEAAVTGC